jgi:hypothetical protein
MLQARASLSICETGLGDKCSTLPPEFGTEAPWIPLETSESQPATPDADAVQSRTVTLTHSLPSVAARMVVLPTTQF